MIHYRTVNADAARPCQCDHCGEDLEGQTVFAQLREGPDKVLADGMFCGPTCAKTALPAIAARKLEVAA